MYKNWNIFRIVPQSCNKVSHLELRIHDYCCMIATYVIVLHKAFNNLLQRLTTLHDSPLKFIVGSNRNAFIQVSNPYCVHICTHTTSLYNERAALEQWLFALSMSNSHM